jgi:hypothetical protein
LSVSPTTLCWVGSNAVGRPTIRARRRPLAWTADDHHVAHQEALELISESAARDQSLINVADHLAQPALHCDDFFGYQQWFLFDDMWASTHPDLAQSLLRYAAHWDPF